MIDFIRAEYWQFFYLFLCLLALYTAFRNGTDAMQRATLLLGAGWLISNVFWMIQPIYFAADGIFGYITAHMWWREREQPLLRLVTVYLAMIFWHALHPQGWLYMAGLNVLFAGQCLIVIGACRNVRAENSRA